MAAGPNVIGGGQLARHDCVKHRAPFEIAPQRRREGFRAGEHRFRFAPLTRLQWKRALNESDFDPSGNLSSNNTSPPHQNRTAPQACNAFVVLAC